MYFKVQIRPSYPGYVRRWKIGSNQPDKGGSYCDSHAHACPSAFPDLGEDEDEDGCDNDDDDDGYGDDGDDYAHGKVGPCCMGCRYSSSPPPRQHFLSAPGQIVQIMIRLNLSDHKLFVLKIFNNAACHKTDVDQHIVITC